VTHLVAIVADSGHRVAELRKTRSLGRFSVTERIAPDLEATLMGRPTRALDVTREQLVESRTAPSFLVHTGKRVVGVVWEEKG